MKRAIFIFITGSLLSFLAFGNQLSASTSCNSVRLVRLHRRKTFTLAAVKISQNVSRLSVASRRTLSDARMFVAARNLCNRLPSFIAVPDLFREQVTPVKSFLSLLNTPPPLRPPIA